MQTLSSIDQALAENQRFRYSLLRDSIVESLSQPTQKICFVPVDRSVHTVYEGEQERVDHFLAAEHWHLYDVECICCGFTLEEDTDWCSICHPVTGRQIYEPPVHEGPYTPKYNWNISDTHCEEIDVFDQSAPNLFKFK